MAPFDNVESAARLHLNRLTGKVCTEIYGGISIGAWISILLGRTWEAQGGGYDSEALIAIEAAEWKISKNGQILCSSDSESGVQSQMYATLQMLIGKEVVSLEIASDGGRLIVLFSDFFKFEAFCSLSYGSDEEQYYIRYDGLRIVRRSGLTSIERTNAE